MYQWCSLGKSLQKASEKGWSSMRVVTVVMNWQVMLSIWDISLMRSVNSDEHLFGEYNLVYNGYWNFFLLWTQPLNSFLNSSYNICILCYLWPWASVYHLRQDKDEENREVPVQPSYHATVLLSGLCRLGANGPLKAFMTTRPVQEPPLSGEAEWVCFQGTVFHCDAFQ